MRLGNINGILGPAGMGGPTRGHTRDHRRPGAAHDPRGGDHHRRQPVHPAHARAVGAAVQVAGEDPPDQSLGLGGGEVGFPLGRLSDTLSAPASVDPSVNVCFAGSDPEPRVVKTLRLVIGVARF